MSAQGGKQMEGGSKSKTEMQRGIGRREAGGKKTEEKRNIHNETGGVGVMETLSHPCSLCKEGTQSF